MAAESRLGSTKSSSAERSKSATAASSRSIADMQIFYKQNFFMSSKICNLTTQLSQPKSTVFQVRPTRKIRNPHNPIRPPRPPQPPPTSPPSQSLIPLLPQLKGKQGPELLPIVRSPREVISDQPVDHPSVEEPVPPHPLRRQRLPHLLPQRPPKPVRDGNAE